MKKDTGMILGIAAIIIIAFIALSSFFIVEVGFVGVRINVLTGETKSFSQGTYPKLPFVHQVVNYDVKTQKQETTAKVKEGWGLAMCESCKKRVYPNDIYCSHCGAKLEWDE